MDTTIPTLLLDCLHEDPQRVTADRLAALDPAAWDGLLALASDKQVIEFFYARLSGRGWASLLPLQVVQRLEQVSLRNAAHNLALSAELKRMAALFHAQKIPIVVLKGTYLAAVVYGNLALRKMVDMDLLVPVEKLGQAAALLEAQGYQPRTTYTVETGMQISQHLPRFVKPAVASIELHWNIVAPDRGCAINPNELWTRAESVTLAGVPLLGLGKEDLLLHLLLHVSYGHRFEMGLRPACDVAAIIRHFGEALDWSLVMARARNWQAQRGVYLALRLAQEMVGAAVPEVVLAGLRPADLDEAIVAAARSQTFSDWRMGRTISPNLANQWYGGLADKIGGLWRTVFLPKPVISAQYGVSVHSPRIYLYYPVRLKDVLVRHWRTAWQLYRGDNSLTPLARHKAMLLRWLAEE
ncbi:MAG: nucleotidyltransferase family protein [Caldilineaceae bacterium]|nr:nucleotidyltransferase family protein [Caldilineaceae bacterium]HRJ42452.1 nucleotidyltransferase family protein [Caldilineaceae bacterium]